MRKLVKSLFSILALNAFLLIVAGAAAAQRLPPEQAKQIIGARATEVLRAIKRGDMRALSSFVHPRKGVRFSPYVYIGKEDRVFTRQAVARFSTDRRRYDWGNLDESDDRIRETPKNYFKDWVYDRDFLSATEVNYNTQKQRGNTIPNVMEFYPRAITVEYFITATENEMYAGLYLVFEKFGNEWYLVGIVRDSWTI